MTATTDAPHQLGAQFQAKFDSNCKGCDRAVYEGDLMGYVDDVAVCDGCYNDAETENWQSIRDMRDAQREAERAADPEGFARREAAVKKWTDSVRAKAAEAPGKEWVESPGSTPGWVRNPDHEPPNEQEAPVAVETVEPGIQALMAAGLLQGQEPGGSGVCEATITDASGKVTEVAIPVPVLDLPGSARLEENRAAGKAPRKRASRAKAKPEVPSPVTGEDPGAATDGLDQVIREGRILAASVVPAGEGTGSIEAAVDMSVLDRPREEDGVARMKAAAAIMATPGPDLPSVALNQVKAAAQERLAQLDANAADWNPGQIEADVLAARGVDVHGPAPVMNDNAYAFRMEPGLPTIPPASGFVDAGKDAALQSGLQSAVDSGVMTPEQAAALGWVAPSVPAEDPWATPPAAPIAANVWDAAVEPPSPAVGLVLNALAGASTPAEEDAIMEALDSLPAYVGGFNHDAAKKEILGILQEAIDYHPRSLQKRIGPSEIGTECDHCLAAKLAGWEQVDRDAWLPTVGTAVHSWIESAFGRIHSGPGGTRRFLTERRVSVGEIDGEEITGSTDLVDVVLGCTWDWKIVGPTTLKSAKTGPSRRYVVQQQLYGRGWNRMGVKVTRVGIAYLPRNAMSLNAGVWWSTDYDERVAVEALERASGFARNIKALATLGPAAVDGYVTGLPRWRRFTDEAGLAREGNALEGAITCLDCARYKDYPADPAKALAQLDGLL